MAVSFAERENLEKSLVITLIHCEGEDDKKYFFYLAIRPKSLKRLKQDGARGNLRIEKYGKVLAWGAGVPEESVRSRMESEYGFDHANIVIFDWSKK